MTAWIAHAPSLQPLLGTIVRPIGAGDLEGGTLQEAVETASFTLYHPLGACRMGSDDTNVFDPALRVRGVESLRIADASIMPAIIRGHTQNPSVMIGERAAQLIAAAG